MITLLSNSSKTSGVNTLAVNNSEVVTVLPKCFTAHLVEEALEVNLSSFLPSGPFTSSNFPLSIPQASQVT